MGQWGLPRSCTWALPAGRVSDLGKRVKDLGGNYSRPSLGCREGGLKGQGSHHWLYLRYYPCMSKYEYRQVIVYGSFDNILIYMLNKQGVSLMTGRPKAFDLHLWPVVELLPENRTVT